MQKEDIRTAGGADIGQKGDVMAKRKTKRSSVTPPPKGSRFIDTTKSWNEGVYAGRAQLLSLFLFLWKEKLGASDDDIERMGHELHDYLDAVIRGEITMLDVDKAME